MLSDEKNQFASRRSVAGRADRTDGLQAQNRLEQIVEQGNRGMAGRARDRVREWLFANHPQRDEIPADCPCKRRRLDKRPLLFVQDLPHSTNSV